MKRLFIFLLCSAGLLETSCKHKTIPVSYVAPPITATKKALCCESNIPKRFASFASDKINYPNVAHGNHKGMIWIKSGDFMMGADNQQASPDEYPKHEVTIDGFWMDATEVTNAEFARFVNA